MAKRGRKKIVINWEPVDRYLEAGCTGVEIAAKLGIHADTLYNVCEREKKMAFSAYAAQKKASGDTLLKAKMFQMAMSGDKTMAIWLSKNRLGYSDKTEQKIDTTTQITGFEMVVPAEHDEDENAHANEGHDTTDEETV